MKTFSNKTSKELNAELANEFNGDISAMANNYNRSNEFILTSLSATEHNPQYRLVSKTISFTKNEKVEIVYGETNEGENKGLELYFFKNDNLKHYRSFRYDFDKVPNRWLGELSNVYSMINNCPAGSKLVI